MVARHIVKSDPISIKIVENGHTDLITLSVVWLRTFGTEKSKNRLNVGGIRTESHPPVLDQLTSLYLFPEGHLIFPRLTFPPVQKYLCLSLATSPRNSFSLAALSRLIPLMPLARQKDSPSLWVNLEHPTLQLTRKSFP